jgi:Ca2+-binding RTX toxin-like protein
MAGTIDFSVGAWVDSNFDGIIDAAPDRVQVDLYAGTYSAMFHGIVTQGQTGDVTTVIGTAGSDRLTGGFGNDTLIGLAGDDALFAHGESDVLNGGAGNDSISGDEGTSTLNGGAGDDKIFALGSDLVVAGSGNDHIFASYAHPLNIACGAGDDLVSLSSFGALHGKVAGGAGVDTLDSSGNISKLNLSSMENMLVGDATLFATRAQLHAFADIRRNLDSGSATPTRMIELSPTDGGTVNLAHNVAPTIPLHLIGSAAGNKLIGSANDDWLTANGSATLLGGLGDDTIEGGANNDRISGEDGNDWLFGYGGKDRFVFERGDGIDRIYDFDPRGERDVVDLRGWTNAKGFNDLIKRHAHVSGSDVILEGSNGDSINLQGTLLKDLEAADFVL